MKYLGLWALLISLAFASPAHAEFKVFMSPEGQLSSLVIFEQSGFARVYGMFTRGLSRFQYDDNMKSLDGIKIALLVDSFVSASPAMKASFTRSALPDKENEVAFVQTEVARFDGSKAKIKGQLIINNIRKDVVMNADLNRYGRVSQTTDVMEDGKETIGLSLHVPFKRSDFSMSSDSAGGAFNDTATLMIDIVGGR